MAKGYGQVEEMSWDELALEITPAALVVGGTIASIGGELYNHNTAVRIGGILLSIGLAIPSFRMVREWARRQQRADPRMMAGYRGPQRPSPWPYGY